MAEAGRIIEEYEAQGYRLTLRQVYYQLVATTVSPTRSAAG
ncbi:MAG: hypothetical protein OXQ29_02430 [Rhodospirillaceae bacterium]|nr:hypothetical protein [Rhodospirillaceae bacterium]